MKSLIFIFLTIIIGLSSCNNQTTKNSKTKAEAYKPIEITVDNPTDITLNDSTKEALFTKAKWLAKQIKYAYKAELHRAVKSKGLVEAVGFCNERAMQISDSLSVVHQVNIKRAALKNRNPLNAMTEKETKIYKDFVIGWINKTPMKGRIIANELGQPVYYNVMMMQKFCLKCHGNSEEIEPQVAQRIKELYPLDKATDITLYQPRGMWAITFPEYSVK